MIRMRLIVTVIRAMAVGVPLVPVLVIVFLRMPVIVIVFVFHHCLASCFLVLTIA
jgi:hypothetical protein